MVPGAFAEYGETLRGNLNPTNKRANAKLSLADDKPSTTKYNEPIRRCLSANSVLKAKLESGQRSEEYSTHLGCGNRCQ